MSNLICNYGCNQPALYQFKNKKWCCSPKANQCPAVREKNRQGNLGNTRGFSRTPHNKLSNEQWIEKYIKRHGQEKFNNIEFITEVSNQPLKLYCKKHKTHFQRSKIYDFVSSKSGGCDLCAREQVDNQHRLTLEKIQKQFIQVHGIKKFNNLDWLEAIYERKQKPITGLRCKKHNHPVTSTAEVLLSPTTTIAGCEICRAQSTLGHYLKKPYKNYDLFYQSKLEKQFLDKLEQEKGTKWFTENVQNGKLFQYFDPSRNKKATYESDFFICGEVYEIKSKYWWDKNGSDTILRQVNINKLNSAAAQFTTFLILENHILKWRLPA